MKYLICGLGNFGNEYADTRHNIGFVVANAFAESLRGSFKNARLADIAQVKYRGKICVIVKPATYMNLSGKAFRYWLEKEKIPVEQSLVISDDISLPLGTLRMKKKGSDGGHNGLSSIISHIGRTDFPRLRIGIGNEYAKGYQSDYVLGKWASSEVKLMTERIPISLDMVKTFIHNGIDMAMNLYNNK